MKTYQQNRRSLEENLEPSNMGDTVLKIDQPKNPLKMPDSNHTNTEKTRCARLMVVIGLALICGFSGATAHAGKVLVPFISYVFHSFPGNSTNQLFSDVNLTFDSISNVSSPGEEFKGPYTSGMDRLDYLAMAPFPFEIGVTDFEEYTSTATFSPFSISGTFGYFSEPGQGHIVLFFGGGGSDSDTGNRKVRLTRMAYWSNPVAINSMQLTEFTVRTYPSFRDFQCRTNGIFMGSFTNDSQHEVDWAVPAQVIDLIEVEVGLLEIEFTTASPAFPNPDITSGALFGKFLFEGEHLGRYLCAFTGDTDNDGVCNNDSICLNDPDTVCIGDTTTGDSDGDQICDDLDLCLGNDATGDTDGDLVCDNLDLCVGNDATGDTDGDLVCDNLDLCVGNDAAGDTDSDGVCDDSDLCPTDPNDADADDDGVCDVDDVCIGDNTTGDSDGDQICDDRDLCVGNDATGDTDEDLVCDDSDNCPNNANTDQADADGDTIGDACEEDSDQDGTIDDDDNCPDDANPDQANSDGDAQGDVCDLDDDNDGVADDSDNCPNVANNDQADFDGDGQGDVCDGDGDGDNIPDDDDRCPGTSLNVTIDGDGCSGQQRIDEVGTPCDFSSLGQYRSEVVAAANAARDSGLLTNKERAAIVRAAAKNTCN